MEDNHLHISQRKGCDAIDYGESNELQHNEKQSSRTL